MFSGRCIGGPLDGEELTAKLQTVDIPCNPHTPSESERASFGDECPNTLFDCIRYRWHDGAWHCAVH